MITKSEVRSPKSERNPKSEIRAPGPGDIRCFGLRHSDFGFSSSGQRFAPISVISRACALRRDHGRSERMLWRAPAAESRTFARFDFTLQHQTTKTFGRFLDTQPGD